MLQTVIYLVSLIYSIAWCYRQPLAPYRFVASLGCITITWFYILRFTFAYEGDNVFDDAYVDVILGGADGNWGFTQMLLTWTIVAMVWSHEAPPYYQMFGVLGAMSASFLVYRPPSSIGQRVQIEYVLASAAGFVCIWMLPRSGSVSELVWWLWGLHAALLFPKFSVSSWRVDACGVFVLLAGLCFATHASSTSSPWPSTDCRISITVDLAVCSLVTALHIYEASSSALVALLCAAASPILSPGAVLALASATRLGLHRRATTWAQHSWARRLRARSGAGGTWMNLGYWREAKDFPAACAELALILGRSVLEKGDAVLCVGCGYGDELGLLHKAYNLKSATGLDANRDAVERFVCNGDLRMLHGAVEDMAHMSGKGLRPREVGKILAVDSIYHCDKSRFFNDCASLLPKSGMVAVTDVVVAEGAPWWVPLVLRAMNIPARNHWTQAQYRKELSKAGFEMDKFESLEPHVLAHWLPAALMGHLDYVLVSAKLSRQKRRPTVAVIGSGMSGCLTARLLQDTHDVKVFEAAPYINFAGRALEIDGVTVDVPLRMVAPCYYSKMAELLGELDICTKPTRWEACFYNSAQTLLKSQAGSVATLVSAAKYLFTMAKLTAVVNWLPPTEDVTFGAYMREKGLADTALYRIYMLPQLSWMLSCELAMVEGYPATVLADLIRKVNPLTSFFQGIVRIHPSNKALEDAMTVGIKVQLNTKLERLGEDRCISGEHFDAVVVATEAPAVHKILPVEWTSFFDEFQYHRSSVVLHRDPALMPKSREDWRVLNVRSTEQEPAAELSVWMNAYYEADFNKDVFQTWNAHRPPAKELVIQESHFARVVHTASSGRLQREVAAVQGRKGFYFAGAFAVHGMGLLEQAIGSAHAAAEAVRRDAGGGERAAAGGA